MSDEQNQTPQDPQEGTDWKTRVRSSLTEKMEKTGSIFREKSSQWKLREKLVKILPQDLARTLPRTMDPMALAEWSGQALQRQGAAFWGTALTVALCTFFLADIAALTLGKYIPEPPTSRSRPSDLIGRHRPSIDDYNVIFTRNLFNSQGLIPGEETPGGGDQGNTPVRTSLPLNLLGTIILEDEMRSIATIEDKSASTVFPLRVEDEIPNKIRVLKIEPYRVIFLNTGSGRREFVELPVDLAVSNPRISLGVNTRGGNQGPGIEKLSPTQFNVSRGEVDKSLADLNKVLTEARAVPNFENGMPAGYKLFQIVPGSIYDKLGLQNGDVICGLDGQNINDPGKAFELLGQLKTASHLELCVKRDGRSQNFAYDIR